MKILNRLNSYIDSNEPIISIIENKIYIENYLDISHFDENSVIIKFSKYNIYIKGKSIVVSKLMSSEILITGVFNSIEFR